MLNTSAWERSSVFKDLGDKCARMAFGECDIQVDTDLRS